MNKRLSISLVITIVIIAMTVTFSMTMVTAMRIFDRTVASVKEKEAMYDKLAEIDRYVRDNDYYTADEATLNDMLASGYVLGSGDKNARYYTANAYTELLNIQNGTLIGIGAEVVKDSGTGYAKVIRVHKGSPAEELGMTKGCYLTSIAGTETRNVSGSDALTRLLRGENGTTVDIVWLNSAAEETTSTVTRRSFVATTVEYTLIGGVCGYIRILNFTENTASELDFAISALTDGGATSILFDLRDNAGANLSAAIECISLICPRGTIATAEYKNGGTQLLGYSEADHAVDLPIVCLVNGSTASGAELFASCMRILSGAKLVGSTTAGKGTIQSEPQMMSDGSALVITIGRLLTSDGSCFDGTGLTVDTERALSADEQIVYYDYSVENDPQVLKAFTVAETLTGNSTVGGVDATPAPDGSASSAVTEDGAEGDSGEGEDASSAASAAA